jgi:tetratricopeptide (TPR) repeat protein
MTMKKLVYVLLFLSQLSWANTGFEAGNDWYKKGNYNQAILAYESVLESHKESADLYFNLGNCYYKLNKVAPAIYNYEKALYLNPTDADIQNNLKFANKMTIDEIKVVPKVGFAHMLHEQMSVFHYDSWAWIAVCFSFVFLACFVGYYFSPYAAKKRLFFVGMCLGLVFLLLAIISAVVEKKYATSEHPAIVFAEMASVKSEPKSGAAEVVLLHEGAKVFVLDSLDNWKKIQLTDGTDGWINHDFIKQVH